VGKQWVTCEAQQIGESNVFAVRVQTRSHGRVQFNCSGLQLLLTDPLARPGIWSPARVSLDLVTSQGSVFTLRPPGSQTTFDVDISQAAG
jgi:hypothetical protein